MSKLLIGLIFGTFFGIILAVSMPGAFSRPWYSKGIYVGDSVSHIAEDGYPFYTFCEKGRVVYRENSEAILVRWSDCKGLQMDDKVIFDIHKESQLRLRS